MRNDWTQEKVDRFNAQATRQVENPVQVESASSRDNSKDLLLDGRFFNGLPTRHVTQTPKNPIPYAVTERDLTLLRELWEYCDNYGEAADDSSVGAVRALNFAEPLRQLIKRLETK